MRDTEGNHLITYAKSYKDYDWIIAMDVHLDHNDDYIGKTNNEIRDLSIGAIIFRGKDNKFIRSLSKYNQLWYN